MFHSERELLANLIVLSPKAARKRFRQSIFDAWEWKCAYCNCQLTEHSATIDHIKSKHKGGHSTRNNMAAACVKCNSNKASRAVFDYYNESHPFYSKQRASKIKQWIEQPTCSIPLSHLSTDQLTSVANDNAFICYAAC
jgi:hypothetical protein